MPGMQLIKLNDFNRAEIMLWDEENQEYCKYRNNPGMGDWRAPEEYFDYPIDEKIDIWSLGMNFYALLTGLYPFPEETIVKQVQKRVRRGDVPFVYPEIGERSFAEKRLAEIMQHCLEYNADERIGITELVKMLQDAVVEYDSHLVVEGASRPWMRNQTSD